MKKWPRNLWIVNTVTKKVYKAANPTVMSVRTEQSPLKAKRLKVVTFICCHLQGNPYQHRFTMRSGVLTDNDTGGAAQVAAAHCPNKRTLDPAVCSQTDPTMRQPAAPWPSPRNVLRQWLTIFSSEYYQILIATHLSTLEGWKAELAWAPCSRLLLESGPDRTRTRDLWVTSPRPYH